MSSALIVSAGMFATGEGDTILAAEIRGGIVCALSVQEKNIGGIAHVDRTGSLGALKALTEAVKAQANTGYISAKIVGCQHLANQIRSYLEECRIPLKGESLTSDPELTVFFYTGTARLRSTKPKSLPHSPAPAKAPDARPAPQVRVAEKVRVLIVDDSRTIRELLRSVCEGDGGIEVVGMAASAEEAEKLLDSVRPDVMTLDINMPGTDGVTFLARLFPVRRLPVIMISALSMEESDLVLSALQIGAVDYIQKPQAGSLAADAQLIREKVRAAARANLRTNAHPGTSRPARPEQSPSSVGTPTGHNRKLPVQLIAIGAYTGGTEALRDILHALPAGLPPIVVVQHIPPLFSRAFAERLNRELPLMVKEAEDNDHLNSGSVYIAPGGRHMVVERAGQNLRIRLHDGPTVKRHKPSVNVLFEAVAQSAPGACIGIILTGMGDDGAEGLLKIKQSGSYTIAQDEATSVVYGMPRVAYEIGAACEVAALDDIHHRLLSSLQRKIPA